MMRGSWKHSLTTAFGVLFANWVQAKLPGTILDPVMLAAGVTGLVSHFLHTWICTNACNHAEEKSG